LIADFGADTRLRVRPDGGRCGNAALYGIDWFKPESRAPASMMSDAGR